MSLSCHYKLEIGSSRKPSLAGRRMNMTESIICSLCEADLMTYIRYRIDASVDGGGDRLHSASEAVDTEWHDSEDEAIEYAQSLTEADDTLILSVGEYHIHASEEPTEYEWGILRTRAPDREVWSSS